MNKEDCTSYSYFRNASALHGLFLHMMSIYTIFCVVMNGDIRGWLLEMPFINKVTETFKSQQITMLNIQNYLGYNPGFKHR